MKLNECLQLAEKLLDGADKNSPDEADLLLGCANNCLSEIASEYLPLVAEKTATAQDGKIPYSQLGETIYDVTEVRRENEKADFELMPSYIKVKKDGEYTVKYCYCPGELSPSDDVPFGTNITARVIAYGIAAEYMLIKGFYEEAVTFDKVFKDALVRASYGRKERRVKRRRWLL